MAGIKISDVGAYIRDQRRSAQYSLRQLADVAGVSNPYLSQIERGLRKPSAEILQQIARGLRISSETLYIRAGILDERPGDTAVSVAIFGDSGLTERQKAVLLDIYESFRRENDAAEADAAKEFSDDRTNEEAEQSADAEGGRGGRKRRVTARGIKGGRAGRAEGRSVEADVEGGDLDSDDGQGGAVQSHVQAGNGEANNREDGHVKDGDIKDRNIKDRNIKDRNIKDRNTRKRIVNQGSDEDDSTAGKRNVRRRNVRPRGGGGTTAAS